MESGSDDDEFDNFEANEASRYPVHDCIEFEDADSLRVSCGWVGIDRRRRP
jgi:hypothetical protein